MINYPKQRDINLGWKLPLSIAWSILLYKELKNLPRCIFFLYVGSGIVLSTAQTFKSDLKSFLSFCLKLQ